VDERRELAIDEQTGLKNYIANERAGIDTSAGLVRNLFGHSIQLGRKYARSKNQDDLYEALRLLGTGCHCLEDFSAHSNYTELALIELGERDIFPHVGRRAQVHLRELRRPVYALCTGTFGGVDFLHSVMGEFDDKATQSEIQELENTMNQAQNNQENTSALQDLLNKVPDGIFGGQNEAQKVDDLKQNAQAHQMQNTRISPRQPEEWLRYINDVQKQIYPILEWHDDIMKSITETIDKIPILPDLMEQIQDQINVFVFSLLAPFVVPIINQVKAELNTGSSEIIQSSVAQQHIVFRDDNSSDPTHSMLSKDHFSNVLNEPAGKVASQVLKWVVPQLIACWDDERIDVDRTLTRIINGVLHHPALRDYGQDGAADGRRLMFEVVQEWWREKPEREKDGLRNQLSRSGVESGRNHKPGVVDHGHGGNKPLGMPTLNTAHSSSATGGPAASAVIGGLSDALGGGSSGGQKYSSGGNDGLGKIAGEAVGGGALGSIVGGLAGGLLGDAFGKDEKKLKKTEQYGHDGSHNQTYTEFGQSGNTYGQAQFSRTDVPGGRQEHYTRYEQKQGGSGGYGAQQFSETSHFDNSGNQTYRHEERSSRADYGSETQ
jgi:Heterokaryon incompatibility protein Het-C